jgi:hypothetical protein
MFSAGKRSAPKLKNVNSKEKLFNVLRVKNTSGSPTIWATLCRASHRLQ